MANLDENKTLPYDPDVAGALPQQAPGPDAGDDVLVFPPAGKAPETAQALFAAADKLGLDAGVVRTADGGFLVPPALADAATLPEGTAQVDEAQTQQLGSDGYAASDPDGLGGSSNAADGNGTRTALNDDGTQGPDGGPGVGAGAGDGGTGTTAGTTPDTAPTFATKGEAKAFADEHGLSVPDANAEAYKQAVTEAYAAQRAQQ